MRKKGILISLIALLVFTMTVKSTADVSDQLKQAQAFMNDEQYEQAKNLYQKILAENPNSDAALEAQKQIVIIHIATNNQAEADAAFEQLSEKYSKHKDFSDAVRVIGDNYLRRSIHEKARDMYKIAVVGATAPDSFWQKMGLAITSIDLADFETGDSLTKQIFSEFADDDRISMASRKIGDAYRHIDHHKQAIELYQYVLDNHADSEHAMWSQMGIATSNNYLGNYDAAEAATEKLCKNYADHPSIYKAIQAIADHYRWRNVQYKRARELYAVASEGMSGPDSIWPKRGFVDLSIRLSDFETANLITDQILNDFEDNKDLPQVACLIAEAYHHAGQYDAASALNKYILEKWPGHKQSLQVKARMARIDIAQGNDEGVERAINNLSAEFKDRPELAEAIFNIGEQYWEQAVSNRQKGLRAKANEDYGKSLAIWERIVRELPDHSHTPNACYFAAECYYHLGQYEKAAEYFQKVLNDWPDYEYGWSAHGFLGACYERFKRSGSIAEAEADIKIEQAYRAVVENYPDCRMVGHACLKLAKLTAKKKRWSEAAGYYGAFINKHPEDKRCKYVLYDLGRTYEKMGKLENATQVYQLIVQQGDPEDSRVKNSMRKLARIKGEER